MLCVCDEPDGVAPTPAETVTVTADEAAVNGPVEPELGVLLPLVVPDPPVVPAAALLCFTNKSVRSGVPFDPLQIAHPRYCNRPRPVASNDAAI